LKKIYQRLLMFFIGVPAVLAVILALPFYNHIVLNILLAAVAILGTMEMQNMLAKKGLLTGKYLLPILAGLFPITTYLEISGIIDSRVTMTIVFSAFIIILIRELFQKKERSFDAVLGSISASSLALIYPGVFLTFITRITALPNPSLLLLIFIVMVFANDTAAYVFGILFGRSGKGIVAVSPNKSLVGFIAGFLFSGISAGVFYIFFPEIFSHSFIAAVGIGLTVGISVIVGDLVESAFKRSANIKDSGYIIPGRGGILDSTDSILFSAPIYFLILTLISS
jgi:phosphatidate cytidylyltransferase